jgi:hypothetical protein
MKKPLESTIGPMGHIGFVIPWVYHFLSHLRLLLARAQNKRTISIGKKCMRDLELMQGILDRAKQGIDMNLLAFRSPDRICYSDSSSAGLGGYSNQGHAWRFKVPDNLHFIASNNLLEFLAAIITPWIDIIGGCLSPGDCTLSMTDSTTGKGWMKKIQLCQAKQQPPPGDSLHRCSKKICINFHKCKHKGLQSVVCREIK